ncbi:MAG TPA: hypothetical protein VNJ09_10710, partial [Chthonomonadales bacterium]|nr:hypothetical protein [Chthonomonadales bacterium]
MTFQQSKRTALFQRKSILPVQAINGAGFRLIAGARGSAQVEIGKDRYTLESSFSYPGPSIGLNVLSEEEPGGESAWKPRVSRPAENQIRIEAQGAYYRLTRTLTLKEHKIAVSDMLTNLANEDVGVIVRNRLVMQSEPDGVQLAGVPEASMRMCAENPTIFIRCPQSRLGVLGEDTLTRLQFESSARQNQAEFSLKHMALRPGESRTLRWTLYPFGPEADYFTFINRVRRDWNVNFTIHGPWGYLDVIAKRDLLRDPEALKAYLRRNKLKIVALMPWLDYDNFNNLTGKPIERDEYKPLMQEAARALKAADPQIKVTGCMEGNIVSLPWGIVKPMYEALPPDQRAQNTGIPFNDRQMEIIKDVPLRWKDCLLKAPDGRYRYELYYRGPKDKPPTPMMALLVYAAPGNDQEKYWLDQARFMMEEVGLDGIYIDQFNLAFSDPQRYSYERWDGVTVDIDPATGKITRRYTDGALVGVGARKKLIEYVLSRKGVMVTNTNAVAEELQSYPIARFMEGEWGFNFVDMKVGEKPPLHVYTCKGQLGSPLSLGSRPSMHKEAGMQIYAEYIMKTVITYLRHGLLYYHYGTEIPETGPGSGEYGPINHMFPITPIEINEGWVEGKERTITCISHDFHWQHKSKPIVHLFDI